MPRQRKTRLAEAQHAHRRLRKRNIQGLNNALTILPMQQVSAHAAEVIEGDDPLVVLICVGAHATEGFQSDLEDLVSAFQPTAQVPLWGDTFTTSEAEDRESERGENGAHDKSMAPSIAMLVCKGDDAKLAPWMCGQGCRGVIEESAENAERTA